MNWSRFSQKSIFGKILRFPLNFLPAKTQMPIMQGKLKGKKWIVGSGIHGYWLGSYEFDKQILFERTIMQGKTVFDLGGHVGFYTLLSSELVGSSGKVYSEPHCQDHRSTKLRWTIWSANWRTCAKVNFSRNPIVQTLMRSFVIV